jgi:hypothetical protein
MTITEEYAHRTPWSEPDQIGLLDGRFPTWTFHPAIRGKVQDNIRIADLVTYETGDAVLKVSSGDNEKVEIELHPDEARDLIVLDNFPRCLLPARLAAMLPADMEE